jgi:dTDP-4-dehydrorhamnose 3,5-epimerase
VSLPNVAVSAVVRHAPVHVATTGASGAASIAAAGASIGTEVPPSSPQAPSRARRTRWRIGRTIACEDAGVKPSTTSLPGVILLDPDPHADARGTLIELYRADRFAALGLAEAFVQDTLTSSVRGVMRGLHYRISPQAKLVMCVEGEVYDVAVDVRRGSPTFGQWFGTSLSAENRRQVYIPSGFAHGYQVITDRASVLYKQTAPFDPADDRALRWNDPALGIPWPLTAPLLSPRDAVAPLLADAELVPPS